MFFPYQKDMEDDFQVVILSVFFIFVALNINVRSIFYYSKFATRTVCITNDVVAYENKQIK